MYEIPLIPEDQVLEFIETNAGLLLLTFLVPTLPTAEISRRDLGVVAPNFEDLVEFGEVDIDIDSPVVEAFDLASIPTLLLFHESKEVERVERCWTPKALEEYLQVATSYYD